MSSKGGNGGNGVKEADGGGRQRANGKEMRGFGERQLNMQLKRVINKRVKGSVAT